jgi:PAS domain S-box-containing protein
MATDLSDANISGLIDLIPTPFLVQDGETVLYANRQSVSLYGYNSIDEFVGTPVIDLVHPDDRETFLARRDRILEGSEASLGIIEQRRIRADGSEIYVLSRGVRGTWQGRKCILGIQIDITERKAAERALALTKERFGIVFDTATVGMIMLDDEGSCVLANANSAHLLGEDSPDGLIGESVDKLFRGRTGGTNPADIATLLVRAMTAREKFEIVDVALNRSDGSSFDGAIRLLPMSL